MNFTARTKEGTVVNIDQVICDQLLLTLKRNLSQILTAEKLARVEAELIHYIALQPKNIADSICLILRTKYPTIEDLHDTAKNEPGVFDRVLLHCIRKVLKHRRQESSRVRIALEAVREKWKSLKRNVSIYFGGPAYRKQKPAVLVSKYIKDKIKCALHTRISTGLQEAEVLEAMDYEYEKKIIQKTLKEKIQELMEEGKLNLNRMAEEGYFRENEERKPAKFLPVTKRLFKWIMWVILTVVKHSVDLAVSLFILFLVCMFLSVATFIVFWYFNLVPAPIVDSYGNFLFTLIKPILDLFGITRADLREQLESN